MLKSSYGKGARLERAVRDFLISKGYFVIRAGASKFPDLIAIRNGSGLFVECKNHKRVPKDPLKLLSKGELDEALTMSIKYGAPFILAYKKDHKLCIAPVDCYAMDVAEELNEISRDGNQ